MCYLVGLVTSLRLTEQISALLLLTWILADKHPDLCKQNKVPLRLKGSSGKHRQGQMLKSTHTVLPGAWLGLSGRIGNDREWSGMIGNDRKWSGTGSCSRYIPGHSVIFGDPQLVAGGRDEADGFPVRAGRLHPQVLPAQGPGGCSGLLERPPGVIYGGWSPFIARPQSRRPVSGLIRSHCARASLVHARYCDSVCVTQWLQ